MAMNEPRPVRVAVVAIEPVVVEPVRVALNDRRIHLRVARNRTEYTKDLQAWHPDLAIVDFDMDAGQTLDELANRLPVIALTRADNSLSAFDRGAADALVTPFAPEEALARVIRLARRAFAPVVRSGELEIDMLRSRVRVGVTEIRLTPTERGLLYLLVTTAGRVLRRDDILDTLWGPDHAADSNVVDQHVRNLRAKLTDVSRWRFAIVTVPGQGYRFLIDDAVESNPFTTGHPRRQLRRSPDCSQEVEFDRVKELDDRLTEPDPWTAAA